MKTQNIFAGIAAVCLLTGCVDERKINRGFRDVSKQLDHQKARVTALEEVCLQLDSRLTDLENNRSPIMPSGDEESSGRKTESSVAASSSAYEQTERTKTPFKSTDSLSRSEIRIYLEGMIPEKVKGWLGNPDQVKEDTNALYWTYNSILFKNTDGSQGNNSLLIVFEQGKVVRAAFHENVEYQTIPLQQPENPKPEAE